jgi:hypothetical protein
MSTDESVPSGKLPLAHLTTSILYGKPSPPKNSFNQITHGDLKVTFVCNPQGSDRRAVNFFPHLT